MLDIKLKIKPGHVSEGDWMSLSSLRQLFWNITYQCNFKCGVCFSNSSKPAPGELTTSEAKEMLLNAKSAGVEEIVISGGEPFFRKDLIEILASMANLDITTRIASNGSLINNEHLRWLRNETLTKSFQISIDTLDPVLYSQIHGAPSNMLDKALRALENILKNGFHTTVSSRLTPETLPGLPQLLDRAVLEGWSTVTIHCPIHLGRTKGAWPQDVDVLMLLEPIFEHFLSLPKHWLIETTIPWAPYHPVIQQLSKKTTVAHYGCVAGRSRLSIHPSGLISPCVCMDFKEAYIGNVKNDDLNDLFLNSPVCKMFRDPGGHGICTDCEFLSACGGGCRAAAFVLSGQLDRQDQSCPVWQKLHSGSHTPN